MPVSVVTLLVNPDEAERLTLARSEGKIQLALRNPLDRSVPSTPRRAAGRCCSGTAPPIRASSPSPRAAADPSPVPPLGSPAARPRSKSSAATSARTKSCASRSH